MSELTSAIKVFPETVVTMNVPSSTRRDLATFSARAFEGYANSSRHVMRTRLPWGGRVKRLAGHDSERVAIRYSRRAVLLALLFGLIAILAMALYASLLRGSYEILALAPFSILFWLVVFVWVAARMSRAAGKRDGG